MKNEITRCSWVNMKNPLYVRYHDEEWSVPQHDDQKLFELLILECFQAGLSWECVLNKRESFRRAFDGFDAEKISGYDEKKCAELMSDKNIIRNRLKISAAVTNSRVFIELQKEYGYFDKYIWGFSEGKIVREPCDLRTSSPLSDSVSRDLKRRGMKFVGTTIIYSYLQAIGVIAAHEKCCFACETDLLGNLRSTV